MLIYRFNVDLKPIFAKANGETVFLVIKAHLDNNYERYWNNDCAEHGQQSNQILYTNPSSHYTDVLLQQFAERGRWVSNYIYCIRLFTRNQEKAQFDRKICQIILFFVVIFVNHIKYQKGIKMSKNYTSATQTRMITLIEVKTKIGKRTDNEPYREVVEYFTTDGRLVAHIDPYETNSMPSGSNYIVQD